MKNPTDLIQEITDAIFLLNGIIVTSCAGACIETQQVPPDKRPLEKLKQDPIAGPMVELLTSQIRTHAAPNGVGQHTSNTPKTSIRPGFTAEPGGC